MSQDYCVSNDPARNSNFSRRWTEDPFIQRRGLQHLGQPTQRVVGRVRRQRGRSRIASLLQAMQLHADDPKIALAAFGLANQERVKLGVSWAELLTRRAV